MPRRREFRLKWTDAAKEKFKTDLNEVGRVGLRNEIETNLETWFGGRAEGYIYRYQSYRFTPLVTLRLESKIVEGNTERYLISVDAVQ